MESTPETDQGERAILDVMLPIELFNKNDGQGHHWSKSHRTRQRLEQELRILKQVREPFDFPVRVVATRILGKKQRFWDSSSVLRGTYKQLEDALVACGWFHDDSYKWITDSHGKQDGSFRKHGPAIRIEVYKDE